MRTAVEPTAPLRGPTDPRAEVKRERGGVAGGSGARPEESNGGRSLRRRLTWLSILVMAAAGAALYIGLPEFTGMKDSWGRLSSGHPLWLGAALLLEIASYGAYVFAFHGLFARAGSRIGWRESYDISLAGVAATRVFAAAGAGGIALTAWALRRSGISRRRIASDITTFYVALYAVFMAALVLVGAGLRAGILRGPAPFGLTVAPAVFGAFVIIAVLLAAKLARGLDERVRVRLPRDKRTMTWLAKVAAASAAVAAGVRGAVLLARRRDRMLLGVLGWWAFDIAVLWACFHVFGKPPPAGILVMAYFTGMLGNVLPLPGGLGGVEGGMIGSLIGFGVDDGLAVAAVLSYRVFAYWLPILPGALAYLRLLHTVRTWEGGPRAQPRSPRQDS
jgi:uncharacterized protein (TIRG00374 family)